MIDMIIIGGGASGMMAAIVAGRRHLKVLLIEQKERLGKKLLATGNGKCNFTNAHMEPSCFYGDQELIRNTLSRFGTEDTLAFFEELGIYAKCRDGYYYPASESAASVQWALEAELRRVGTEIRTKTQVTGIRSGKKGYTVETSRGSFQAPNLLIACGLKAAPKLGSDGSLLDMIRGLGHSISPVLPALCGFYAQGMDFKTAAGVRLEAGLQLRVDGQEAASDRGEVQFNDYGISGIPVFQISHRAVRGLYEKKQVEVLMDLLPEFSKEKVLTALFAAGERNSGFSAEALLMGLLPQKMIHALLPACGIDVSQKIHTLSGEQIKRLAESIKAFPIRLKKARDFEFAQVCCGGIPAEEIDGSTMESRKRKKLYFTGELVDVDGICGGYNLQWAWATGFIAGSSVSAASE